MTNKHFRIQNTHCILCHVILKSHVVIMDYTFKSHRVAVIVLRGKNGVCFVWIVEFSRVIEKYILKILEVRYTRHRGDLSSDDFLRGYNVASELQVFPRDFKRCFVGSWQCIEHKTVVFCLRHRFERGTTRGCTSERSDDKVRVHAPTYTRV